MRNSSILILLGLVVLSNAATKCGSAPWWTDIKTNLIDKWDTTDSFVKNFNSLKTTYDALEATTVTATHEVTKGHCKSYFTVDKDKSCCSSADHVNMINLAVKASISAAIPRGKGDACKALKYAFQKAVSVCNQAKNSGASSASTTASTSPVSGSASTSIATSNSTSNSTISTSVKNSTASVSVSVSVSISSGSSAGKPESVQKIMDEAEKAGKQSEAKSKKALGDAALVIAQQLRGTLCAICGDPDKSSTLFDITNKTWLVNQAAMTDYINQISSALNDTAANGKDCLDYVQYNQQRYENSLGSCEGAAQVITDYKAKLTPCTSETECQKSATDCFNPLTTGCVTNIVVDTTVAGRRALQAQKRVLAGATYSSTSTGGSTSVANPSEDGAIVVGGESISSINQQAATADSEYEATGGGSVNYDEALKAENGNSNLFSVSFIGFILTIAFYILI